MRNDFFFFFTGTQPPRDVIWPKMIVMTNAYDKGLELVLPHPSVMVSCTVPPSFIKLNIDEVL